MVSSSKNLVRDTSNRSNTPQKVGGVMIKKANPGMQDNSYQMVSGGTKQMQSHQVLSKQTNSAANFQN